MAQTTPPPQVKRVFGEIAKEDEERLNQIFHEIVHMDHQDDYSGKQKARIEEFLMRPTPPHETLFQRMSKRTNHYFNSIRSLFKSDNINEIIKEKVTNAKDKMVKALKYNIIEPLNDIYDDTADYFAYANQNIDPIKEEVKKKGYNRHTTILDVAKDLNLTGKTAVITGGTSGIGVHVAKGLAYAGAQVILPCRDPLLCAIVVDRLKDETNNQDIYCMKGNLTEVPEIMRMINDLKRQNIEPDIVVNMAAEVLPRLPLKAFLGTYDRTFSSTFIGPYMFTEMLLYKLNQEKISKKVNVINVTCGAHKLGGININELNLDNLHKYKGLRGYALAKFGNLAYTMESHYRYRSRGLEHINFNAINPGMADTDLFSNSFIMSPIRYLFKVLGLLKRPEEAAAPIVFLAGSPLFENVSGLYFESFKQKKPVRSLRWNEYLRRWGEFASDIAEGALLKYEDLILKHNVDFLNKRPYPTKEELQEFIFKRIDDIMGEKARQHKEGLKRRLEQIGIDFEDLGISKDFDISQLSNTLAMETTLPINEDEFYKVTLFPDRKYEREIYIPKYEEYLGMKEAYIGPENARVDPSTLVPSKTNASLINTYKNKTKNQIIFNEEEYRPNTFDNKKAYEELLLKMRKKRVQENIERRKEEEEEILQNEKGIKKMFKYVWNLLRVD